MHAPYTRKVLHFKFDRAQYKSGGKQRLGSITKAADACLRCLLVNGARAVIANLGEKQDRFSHGVRNLVERRGYWRAA